MIASSSPSLWRHKPRDHRKNTLRSLRIPNFPFVSFWLFLEKKKNVTLDPKRFYLSSGLYWIYMSYALTCLSSNTLDLGSRCFIASWDDREMRAASHNVTFLNLHELMKWGIEREPVAGLLDRFLQKNSDQACVHSLSLLFSHKIWQNTCHVHLADYEPLLLCL